MAKYRKNDDGTYTYKDDWNNLLDSMGDFLGIGRNKAGGADIDTTEGQRAAQMGYDSEQWGKFFGGTGWYNLGGKDPAYNEGSYRDYLLNPNFNKGNLYKAVSDFGIDTNSDAYDSAIKGIFTDRVDSVPFGYNTADAGGIFDSMAKIPGSTFGGTYAALGAYNLMDINEGMANYVKNQANDPLTKDNLKPFVTSSDSGFINPLAAENGAIVNYGKVQAEKDEIIVLPDGSIVEPASKTFHNKMDSDEVTEYLPQGSIVFSNKVMVKKSAFEGKKGDVVAASVANYTETEKPELPIEFKISELFGSKKEMSSAELIKEVKRRFPIKEVQDNGTENPKLTPIDKQTNEQNKLARIPYITAIFDKVKNKMKTDTTDKPVKANAGAILAAAQAGGNILGALGSQYMNYLNNKKNAELLKKWYDTSNANLNTGVAIGALSTLAQDPYIPKKNTDIQRAYLNEMQDRVPYYLQDSAYNQLTADSAMNNRYLAENTSSFSKYANAAGASDARLLDAKSRLATNFASQNMGLQNAKLNAQLGYEEKWAGEEQNRISKILQNINAIKANLGDQGVNYFNQKNALESGLTNAKVAQNTAYANSTAGNFQTLMSGGAQAVSQLAAPTKLGFTPDKDIANLFSTPVVTNIQDYAKGKFGVQNRLEPEIPTERVAPVPPIVQPPVSAPYNPPVYTPEPITPTEPVNPPASSEPIAPVQPPATNDDIIKQPKQPVPPATTPAETPTQQPPTTPPAEQQSPVSPAEDTANTPAVKDKVETPEEVSKRIKDEDAAYSNTRKDAIRKAKEAEATGEGISASDDNYKAALKIIVKRTPPKDIQEQRDRVAKYQELADDANEKWAAGIGSIDDWIDYENRADVEYEILQDMTREKHRSMVAAAKTVGQSSNNQVRDIPPAIQPIPPRPVSPVQPTQPTTSNVPQPKVQYNEDDYRAKYAYMNESQNEFIEANREIQKEYYVPDHVMLKAHEAGATTAEYDDTSGKIVFKDDDGNVVYDNQAIHPEGRGRIEIVKEYIDKTVPEAGVEVTPTDMDELYERASSEGVSLDNMEIVEVEDVEDDEDFKYFRNKHDKKWSKIDKKHKYKSNGYAIVLRDDDGNIVASAPVYDINDKRAVRKVMNKMKKIKNK